MVTFTPISIGANLLSNWYGARASLAAARAAPAQIPATPADSLAAQTADITPPWDTGAQTPSTEELRRKVLASGVFIDSNDLGGFSDLDAPDDVKKLFALHQGVKALWAVAGEAAGKDITDAGRRSLDRQFQEGFQQIQDFLATESFENAQVVRGEARTEAKSTVPVVKPLQEFTTGVLHRGNFDDAVAGFASATPFTISSRSLTGVVTDVTIDVSAMDPGETKNMRNVTAFINTQLEAAGLTTRFDDVRLNGTGEDVTPEYGFTIKGTSTEALSFSVPPADAQASMFVAGASGKLSTPIDTGDETIPAPIPTVRAGQITRLTGLDTPGGPTADPSIRIEALGDPSSVKVNPNLKIEGRENEPPGPPTEDFLITKTVAAADGFYALAETAGEVNGVGPQGERDVVLLKYDAAGRQLWARSVGAGDSAEGLALDVGADGTVAVAGSLTGTMGGTVDLGRKDAFVASYDGDGELNWLKRFGSFRDDAIESVAVGDDGRVFVGGVTGGSLNGAPLEGTSDGFVRAFDAAGAVSWTAQGADLGVDSTTALEFENGELYYGGVGADQAVVRKLDPNAGTEVPGWSWTDPNFAFGQITDIALDAGAGTVYVAGGARDNFTAPSDANAGARDAFVLGVDSTTAAVDFARFIGGQGEDVAADLVVDAGSVYVAGRTDSDLTTGDSLGGGRQSFVARLDGATGALDWTTQIEGRNNSSQAGGVVVLPGTDNTLAAFGLPTGSLELSDSLAVADRTTAKAGDYFDLRVNGVKKRITLDAGDSLRGLAFKVDLALGSRGDATTRRIPGGDGVSIKPRDGVEIELIAGREGNDLLKALGIEPGKVAKPDPDVEDQPEEIELKLPRTLSIADRDSAQAAVDILNDAMSAIRKGYREITKDPAREEALEQAQRLNGEPPAFLAARIANYQAALSRLSGGF